MSADLEEALRKAVAKEAAAQELGKKNKAKAAAEETKIREGKAKIAGFEKARKYVDLYFFNNGRHSVVKHFSETRSCIDVRATSLLLATALDMAIKDAQAEVAAVEEARKQTQAEEAAIETTITEAQAEVAAVEEARKKAQEARKKSEDQVETRARKGGVPEIYRAADDGKVEILQHLISSRADVNSTVGPSKKSCLHVAVERGHMDCVSLLIDNKANVNARAADADTNTPLMVAANYGRTEAVKALIAAKADVNAMDQRICSSLYSAASGGHTGCVRLLLENHANVNAENLDDDTPLIIAACNGRAETVRALLQQDGVRVNTKNNEGKTALALAHLRLSGEKSPLAAANLRKVVDALRAARATE